MLGANVAEMQQEMLQQQSTVTDKLNHIIATNLPSAAKDKRKRYQVISDLDFSIRYKQVLIPNRV
uniref:Uncharacterized protein n=1 Tax=Arundo donax TaxID=35708 RepID=A0A0A9U6K2_ARUDO